MLIYNEPMATLFFVALAILWAAMEKAVKPTLKERVQPFLASEKRDWGFLTPYMEWTKTDWYTTAGLPFVAFVIATFGSWQLDTTILDVFNLHIAGMPDWMGYVATGLIALAGEQFAHDATDFIKAWLRGFG
jgi:hypothetical protein